MKGMKNFIPYAAVSRHNILLHRSLLLITLLRDLLSFAAVKHQVEISKQNRVIDTIADINLLSFKQNMNLRINNALIIIENMKTIISLYSKDLCSTFLLRSALVESINLLQRLEKKRGKKEARGRKKEIKGDRKAFYKAKKETEDVCSRRRSSKVKKGALSESFFALMRCSTCKSMFPWENLTLRVDKRSLCRNYIFPDECKHRSECARSKERCLCAATSFLVRCPSASFPPQPPPLPPCGETQILKYFLRVSRNAPRV